MPIDKWIKSGELQNLVSEETGMGKSTFCKLIKEATDNGILKSKDSGRNKLYMLK